MNKAAELLALATHRQLRIGALQRCPDCGKPNYCRWHRYAYVNWLQKSLPYLQIMASIE